ncbi:MAG: ArnT family glycosyltransferase [Paracoccaceae bacterium]
MPNAIADPTLSETEPVRAPLRAAHQTVFVAVFALTLFRVVLALFDRTELSTDEAQYWFWGQTFDFGAYSKPPLIGWILRLSTDLLGQTVAAVRLPSALFHGASALLLFHAALRIASPPVALLASLSYLTTPAVALGTALMTTDTPMLFAAALALLAQIGLAEARSGGRRAIGWALLFGLSLGLGILAKHAMLFWIAGAFVAGWLSPRLRPRAGDAALAAAVMIAVILPHLAWLARHDFITLHHIQDITRGHALSASRPLQFLAEQLVVMGPILFPAMLIAAARAQRGTWARGLAALALVPLLIVVAQGVKGPVLANWAVLYLIPGSVLAALWLVHHPWLARISLGLGLAISLALPVVKVSGAGLPWETDKPLLSRYLGHGEPAQWALEAAKAAGAGTLVAQGRGIIADLSWFGADAGLAIRAMPPAGKPTHHWEATAPFDPNADPRPVLLLWSDEAPVPCGQAILISRFKAPPGAYGGNTFNLWRLEYPDCLAIQGAADE